MASSPICMAPWVHSFVHTSGDRGLCCVSERFRIADGDFWNSTFLRNVRQQLMDGKIPSACSVCQHSPKPMYLDFNRRFGHLADDLLRATESNGYVHHRPISFDHRSSYVCNFKCRMCNAEYSSSRKKEQIELQGIDSLKEWIRPENESLTQAHHREYTEKELLTAIRERSVREIYWAGGEPLLNPFHWEAMALLIELGLGAEVQVAYNTNLSVLEYRGKKFLDDILPMLPKIQLMVSLDGTGEVGEYIRTGMNWSQMQLNIDKTLARMSRQQSLAISHCLTTPGIFDLGNFLDFTQQKNLEVVSQLVDFGFESNFENPLSPLFFPKAIRGPWIERTLRKISAKRQSSNETVFYLLDKIMSHEDLPFTEERSRNIRGTLKKFRKVEEFRGGNKLEQFLKDEPELLAWLNHAF